MSTANEEFSDLMPHRIRVRANTQYNDYGRPIPGSGTNLTYRCLIDDTTQTVRNADGETITVAQTAYVAPVPVESVDDLPVDIESNSIIDILSPRPRNSASVGSIERHYDSDDGEGMLHNLVVRFV
jgi:hypothetical protein